MSQKDSEKNIRGAIAEINAEGRLAGIDEAVRTVTDPEIRKKIRRRAYRNNIIPVEPNERKILIRPHRKAKPIR